MAIKAFSRVCNATYCTARKMFLMVPVLYREKPFFDVVEAVFARFQPDTSSNLDASGQQKNEEVQ